MLSRHRGNPPSADQGQRGKVRIQWRPTCGRRERHAWCLCWHWSGLRGVAGGPATLCRSKRCVRGPENHVPVRHDRRRLRRHGRRPDRRLRHGRCAPASRAPSLFRLSATRAPNHALTAREIGPPSADFDGYPMHGGGPGGEKVKEIPLDFFNGAWPPCIVPLHSASQLRPSPGAAFARGGAWPCSTGLGQHSR